MVCGGGRDFGAMVVVVVVRNSGVFSTSSGCKQGLVILFLGQELLFCAVVGVDNDDDDKVYQKQK